MRHIIVSLELFQGRLVSGHGELVNSAVETIDKVTQPASSLKALLQKDSKRATARKRTSTKIMAGKVMTEKRISRWSLQCVGSDQEAQLARYSLRLSSTLKPLPGISAISKTT